jgi:hypothetical protein
MEKYLKGKEVNICSLSGELTQSIKINDNLITIHKLSGNSFNTVLIF